MDIRLEDNVWIINCGECIIRKGRFAKYVIYDYNGEVVYLDDDFESCLIWCLNR